MTDRRDWQLAYLKQARSDWTAYQRTREGRWEPCHRLLFLQMASEKLGKALLLAGHSTLENITQSHAAFVKFMRLAGNNRNLRNALGMKKSNFRFHFKRLLPLAYQIELLAPALSQGGPNPEYPWLDQSGNLCVPTDYAFPLSKMLQTPQGVQLLKYIEFFLTSFEELFLL
jgi:hypothetical protein